MRLCSQPRRHPHRNSIQIKVVDLNSCHFRFSMGFASNGLSWVVLGTRLLRAAAAMGACLHSSAQCPLSK